MAKDPSHPNNHPADGDDLAEKISELRDEIKTFEVKQEKVIADLGRRAKIIITVISACAALTAFLLVSMYVIPHQEVGYSLKSNYEIQDLRGGKINTWISWNLVKEDLFHIHVLASPLATDERMKVIRDVIFSNQTVTANGQTYYKGWYGALQDASHRNTKLSVPLHLHTVITDTGTGNIVIDLTDLGNADGYSAKTKSIADVGNHQILKSEITIYGVDKLSNEQLALALRHELGHGFGLAHSGDPNDLMYVTFNQEHPYISECDIEALVGLYNGDQNSQVTCKK